MRGQFVLIGFCVFQTLLNFHLLNRETATEREADFSGIIETERDEKFYAEPEEFRVGRPPKVFTLSEFNFTTTPFPVLEQCSCENGKQELQKDRNYVNLTNWGTELPMKFIEYLGASFVIDSFKTRKMRHENYLKRREWSRPLKIFANPSVPLKYPSSGVQCRPQGQVEIPMKIMQFFEYATVKIVANYGEISVGAEGTAKQSLELDGDSTFLNKQLQNLTYNNVMYDSLMYYDTVTVWIKGFETVKFQIEVAREKLEILQVGQ